MAKPEIREQITESARGARVDTDRGIIHDVKLIGFNSRNRRHYPPEVLCVAVPLYEGVKVNIDHPDGNDPGKPRKYGERFGVIRNVRFEAGRGLFGDCQFNPKHPAAEQVCWDAENNAEALGFSHNALLRMGRKTRGIETVEAIVSVRSMDLVADPATTKSLFESEEPMDETQTETPGTPEDQMKGAFTRMVMAAIEDDSLDTKATMKKIAGILKMQAKMMGEPMGDSTEGGDKQAEEQYREQITALTTQLESLQKENQKAQLEASIESALEEAGFDSKDEVQVSPLFRKQLMATAQESDRSAMIKDRAALLGVKKNSSSGVQYRPPVTATEQLDTRSFASRLLN